MALGRVVVIGAGVAGLAAARRLRESGVDTVLIEAGLRAGGRARTECFAGAPFDHGASWLHDADHNPLAALATVEDGLQDSGTERDERISIEGRPANSAEVAALDRVFTLVDQIAATSEEGPDRTLEAALSPLAESPWLPLLTLWEGAIIAAADANRLGAADWRLNRLGGRNMVPPEGVGAYVVRKLATAVEVGTAAQAVCWNGTGVRVETPRGTIGADAVIVTVSTGVLASGAIRFDPALPPAVSGAVARLPMGLLSKVVGVAHGSVGLATGALVMDLASPMTFNAFPEGRRHVVGFFGGELAWSLARDPAGARALFRAEWDRALGPGASRAFAPGEMPTDWGTDPLFLGSYAYAGPGDSGQRAVLAEAFPGERIVFAGEATRTDGFAGTVGGAFLSGVAAANRLLRQPHPRRTQAASA